MILKFDCGDDYWIYDGVEKIRVTKYTSDFNWNETESDCDYLLIHSAQLNRSVVEETDQVINSVCGLQLYMKKKSGEEHTVIFDIPLFVLNDEGKTIDVYRP